MSEHASDPTRNESSSPEQALADSGAELREKIDSRPILGEERKQALLASWRAVLSGKARPEVLPIPPEVEAVVWSEERRLPGPLDQPPTAGGTRRLDALALRGDAGVVALPLGWCGSSRRP